MTYFSLYFAMMILYYNNNNKKVLALGAQKSFDIQLL